MMKLIDTHVHLSDTEYIGHIEELIADSVISLNCVEMDGIFSRFLAVRKMRRSQHTHELHPFEIGKNGLELLGAG